MNNEIPFAKPLLDVSPRCGLHVLVADVMALNSDQLYCYALERVSEQRRQAIIGMKSRMAQNLRLGATLLLDRLLREHGLYERDMNYALSEHGKPYFSNGSHMAFSLSHSGTLAAAALMPQPFVSYTPDAWKQANPEPRQYSLLGLDIQRPTRVREQLATSVFSEAEQAQIMADAQPDQTFTRLWARHESHVKATGQGVSRPLPPIPAEADLFEYELGGYQLCICLI